MVNFLVEPSKTALIIVDMQNVFVEGYPFSAPEGLEVLARLNRLAGFCHEAGIQVIYTAHVVRPDHANIGIKSSFSAMGRQPLACRTWDLELFLLRKCSASPVL